MELLNKGLRSFICFRRTFLMVSSLSKCPSRSETASNILYSNCISAVSRNGCNLVYSHCILAVQRCGCNLVYSNSISAVQCWCTVYIFQLYNAMDVTCCTVSILHLCAVSIDRYYAIVKEPLLYQVTMQYTVQWTLYSRNSTVYSIHSAVR